MFFLLIWPTQSAIGYNMLQPTRIVQPILLLPEIESGTESYVQCSFRLCLIICVIFWYIIYIYNILQLTHWLHPCIIYFLVIYYIYLPPTLRFATAAVWTSCAVALRSSFSQHGLAQVGTGESGGFCFLAMVQNLQYICKMGMYQNLPYLILGRWTSICQQFGVSPGRQGFDPSPDHVISTTLIEALWNGRSHVPYDRRVRVPTPSIKGVVISLFGMNIYQLSDIDRGNGPFLETDL